MDMYLSQYIPSLELLGFNFLIVFEKVSINCICLIIFVSKE